MKLPQKPPPAKVKLKTVPTKSMEIKTPTDLIDRHFLSEEIKAQSDTWDAEAHFIKFEQALDTLDLISDALPDDPKLSNALNGLHSNFSKIYKQSWPKLMT